MSDNLDDTKARAARLRALWTLRTQEDDIRQLVDTVLAKEGLDIFKLAEEKPDVFDELHDSCFSMIEQTGQHLDDDLGGYEEFRT